MTTSPSRRTAAALILSVAALALAAACGGSSNSSKSAGGGGSTPSSSTTQPATSSGGGGGSLSDAAFCDLAKKWSVKERQQVSSLQGISSPATLKALYQSLGSILSQFAASAPSDIKSDVQVLDGAFQKLNSILAQSNYDITKAAPKLLANKNIFEGARVKAAIARLDAWGRAHSCTLKR